MVLLFVAIVIVALGAYLVLKDRARQERIAQRRLEEGVKRRDQQVEERRKQERQGASRASQEDRPSSSKRAKARE